MKPLKTTVTILLAVSISQVCYAFSKVPAVVADTCPAEETIQQVASTYTAPGGWAGVLQTNPGKVKAFAMVIYKPTDTDHPFQKGELLRCSYKLDNGKVLDLYLEIVVLIIKN